MEVVSPVRTTQSTCICIYLSSHAGAGWGGCTVSLVEEARVPEFIEKLKTSYPPYHGLQGEELAEVIFPTKPSSGACGTSFSTICDAIRDIR